MKAACDRAAGATPTLLQVEAARLWITEQTANVLRPHALPADQLGHVVRAQKVDEVCTLLIAPFAVP